MGAYLIGFLKSLFGLAFIIFGLTNHFTEKHIEDHDVLDAGIHKTSLRLLNFLSTYIDTILQTATTI